MRILGGRRKKFIVIGLILFSLASCFAYWEISGEEFTCSPEFDYYSQNWLGAEVVGRGGQVRGLLVLFLIHC